MGVASQLSPGWKSLPSPWLKAWPQLFNISMKLFKSYRYVKWPLLRLVTKLLLCKTTLNGPAPCIPSPSSDMWGWGHPIFFNISWTSWVLDPITNPYLGAPWLHPVTLLQSMPDLPCFVLTGAWHIDYPCIRYNPLVASSRGLKILTQAISSFII